MLVLTRKIGETIHIGGQVTVEVKRVSGNRVTLGIEAPRELVILRGELVQGDSRPELGSKVSVNPAEG
jgi:carbon storage regulator